MSCSLCGRRKGKRACPARGAEICSQCCGTKRLVEVDCPPDCAYLTGAHAPGWDGRAADRERDLKRLGPHVAGLAERQLRLLLLALTGINGIRHRRSGIEDAVLLEAVALSRVCVDGACQTLCSAPVRVRVQGATSMRIRENRASSSTPASCEQTARPTWTGPRSRTVTEPTG